MRAVIGDLAALFVQSNGELGVVVWIPGLGAHVVHCVLGARVWAAFVGDFVGADAAGVGLVGFGFGVG